jgi:hypothetical protein
MSSRRALGGVGFSCPIGSKTAALAKRRAWTAQASNPAEASRIPSGSALSPSEAGRALVRFGLITNEIIICNTTVYREVLAPVKPGSADRWSEPKPVVVRRRLDHARHEGLGSCRG